MKWKPGATIERNKEELRFCYREPEEEQSKEKTAAKEDYYIIDAIESGMTDDKELLQLVGDTEQTNDVVSGFRLAQFILDYGEYISNDVGHMMIEV